MYKVILLLAVPIVLLIGYWGERDSTSPEDSIIRAPTEEAEAAKSEVLSIKLYPGAVVQGEPVLITVEGLGSVSSIKSFTYKGIPLKVFTYKGKPSALVGIDLHATTGTYSIVLKTIDGKTVSARLAIGERQVVKEVFGIPDKLGGDTPEAERALISTLAEEARIINALPTIEKKLWNDEFAYPLHGSIEITDGYGYSRTTGTSNLSHRGTDFRAEIGTPVYAMNDGIVRFSGFLRNYGNMVVIDHGFGLSTIYMHLSEIGVKVGGEVKKGELLGKSGDTGYVLGPHLHISVRIYDISIDPMKFMALFGE